ncbi:hypothetical protein NESM_000067900 [Novymonas esmeraldas]|uniref:Uncharacterized protein n=1 Tax=Novymonas esmeraldas TaxID=1808958 RepID=A0AAW0F4P2_9TRYP
MSAHSEEYWRRQLAQTEAEYEQMIAGLRDEVERQQRRCSDLMHERAMLRATAAADIRDYCQQYVAKQQQQQQSRPVTARVQTAVKKDADAVPLSALLAFLREYSHGLLQLPDSHRKRARPDGPLHPLHHRLRQRMLEHHRRGGRESDDADAWYAGDYGDSSGTTPPATPSLSSSLSPTWPAVSPRFVDGEGPRESRAPATATGSSDKDGPASSRVGGAKLARDAAVPMGMASAAAGGGRHVMAPSPSAPSAPPPR